nr:hypothetical protein [Pandoravirus massiliensis]
MALPIVVVVTAGDAPSTTGVAVATVAILPREFLAPVRFALFFFFFLRKSLSSRLSPSSRRCALSFFFKQKRKKNQFGAKPSKEDVRALGRLGEGFPWAWAGFVASTDRSIGHGGQATTRPNVHVCVYVCCLRACAVMRTHPNGAGRSGQFSLLDFFLVLKKIQVALPLGSARQTTSP